MIQTFFAIKQKQTQSFDKAGKRIPVTVFKADPCYITQIKTTETDGYNAVQLGFGNLKNHLIIKPQAGHAKKAGLDTKITPRFFKEFRLQIVPEDIKLGQKISVDMVVKPGDTVTVVGTSKGKGFAGVVKRYKFKGGPATHGQSDRERAPGSIGGTTQLGRVFKGKRMAGRMGQETITVKGLTVISVDAEKALLTIKGLVPGSKRSVLMITKTKEVPIEEAEKVLDEKPDEKETKDEKKADEDKEPLIADASADKEETEETSTEKKEEEQNDSEKKDEAVQENSKQ
jgi:large subunit ribosomal protein L3